MPESTWKSRLGPPLAALTAIGTLAVLVSTSAGASGGPWHPPDCAKATGWAGRAAALPPPRGPGDLRGEAWFRLDPVLDDRGALVGQRLRLGRHGHGSVRTVDLPPESSAAGPVGRLVLAAADDGRRSVVLAFDLAAGCRRVLAEDAAVVRRVLLDPAGGSLYEARVDRGSRADLGVWRRPLEGDAAVRVLDPLAADARFGPTFSTELSWELGGDRLVVQSCGQTACRTRILDAATREVLAHADPALGELLGVADGRIVAYGACRGLPCPIVAVDPRTGGSRSLATDAGLAALILTPEGARLVHEHGGRARHLRVVDPASGTLVADHPIPADLRLAPPGPRALAGTRLPAGWLVLAPDARPGSGTAGGPSVLVSPLDGRLARLPEVTR